MSLFSFFIFKASTLTVDIQHPRTLLNIVC